MKHAAALVLFAFGLATETSGAAASPPSTALAQTVSAPTAPHSDILRLAHPIRGVANDYDPLLEDIGNARFVLLGEDTHGTLEFYRERARITRRLIEERGFNAVVIESDWADAARMERYVGGAPDDATAEQALGGVQRFPTWMWRNPVFRDLLEWLHEHNAAGAPNPARVHVYGMDSHGMASSAVALLGWLARADPEEAARTRERYECLARHDFNGPRYAAALNQSRDNSCEQAVTQVYETLYERFASGEAGDEGFAALQNARTVRTAEAYIRGQLTPNTIVWNIRDRHLADVVEAVAAYRTRVDGTPARLVIWAHNTHVGDARATARGASGSWTLGQLMRQRYPGETFLVAFSTRAGTVRAAPFWDEDDRVYRIAPAPAQSVPALLGRVALPQYLLLSREAGGVAALARNRLHRAIGAVYWRRFERREH